VGLVNNLSDTLTDHWVWFGVAAVVLVVILAAYNFANDATKFSHRRRASEG
jgi:hypothetical protein